METILSKRNRTKLHYNGFLYVFDRLSSDGEVRFWRCDRRHTRKINCKGRLHTDLNNTILREVSDHQCEQIITREEAKVKQRKSRQFWFESISPTTMEQSNGNIETMRSKTKLHHEGVLYVYDKMSASCDVKFWRCEFSNARDVRCKGRLHTDLNGNVLKVVGEHVCPSSAARVESQRIITAIKRRAVDTMESTDEILAHALQNVSPSVLAAVPSKNAANKLIKRARTEHKGVSENFKHLEGIDSAHSLGLTSTIDADGRNYDDQCHQQQTMRQTEQFPSVVLQTNQQQNANASTSAFVHQQQQQRIAKSNFPANSQSAISNFDISLHHSTVPIALDSDYATQRDSVVDPSSSALCAASSMAVNSSFAYPSPIDNKIDQALDLVKTQLTLAVRKEMKNLRSTVIELEDKVLLLECENQLLRQYAPGEVEANLPSLVRQMRDRQQRVASAQKYSNQQQPHVVASSSSIDVIQQSASASAQVTDASPQNSSTVGNIWNGRAKASEIKADFGRNGL